MLIGNTFVMPSVPDTVIAAIKRLEVKEGDILQVSVNRIMSRTAYEHIQESIKPCLATVGLHNVLTIICEEGLDLDVLPEDEMRKHGWVRVQTAEPS